MALGGRLTAEQKGRAAGTPVHGAASSLKKMLGLGGSKKAQPKMRPAPAPGPITMMTQRTFSHINDPAYRATAKPGVRGPGYVDPRDQPRTSMSGKTSSPPKRRKGKKVRKPRK
jgi:hypothetical protein